MGVVVGFFNNNAFLTQVIITPF